MKKAFTLVELIIVIGIIAVLMASLMVATSGATDTARAAKCMANIRNLAAASNAYAMEKGWYPLAGSRQEVTYSSGQAAYDEQVGWISWLSTGDPFGHRSGQRPSQPVKNLKVCPSGGTGNEEDATFAITNGAIWKFTGRIRDIYRCPAHERYCREQGAQPPEFSYVMNMKFCFDTSKGQDATASPGGRGVNYNDNSIIRSAERTLMFAELPTKRMGTGTEDDAGGSGDEYASDCTLHYHVTVDGKELGKEWSGKTEAIGFNHVGSKKKRYGHVAFADGHVEKITYGGGISPEELTALLCEGIDVAFDGKQWKKIDGQD